VDLTGEAIVGEVGRLVGVAELWSRRMSVAEPFRDAAETGDLASGLIRV
jgi:hypothetical protein